MSPSTADHWVVVATRTLGGRETPVRVGGRFGHLDDGQRIAFSELSDRRQPCRVGGAVVPGQLDALLKRQGSHVHGQALRHSQLAPGGTCGANPGVDQARGARIKPWIGANAPKGVR